MGTNVLTTTYNTWFMYVIKCTNYPLQDLQKIMDDAKYGVIYFSMGTMLQSSKLPQVIKMGLLDIFRELKQTIIWKFEEHLPNLPKNVHIVSWAPQSSILGTFRMRGRNRFL